MKISTATCPRLVFWETTAGCNLRCQHCRRLDVMEQMSREDMTTSQALAFVDQLAEMGKMILVLSGGEPLMRPDIFDIARHAKSRGLRVALATNGTMIDATTAWRIHDAGIDRVAISLDGVNPRTHDEFRGIPGSFEKSVAALTALRSLGVGTQVNFTVARHNVGEVPAIYARALELGVDALHFFMLVPVGCGVEIAESQMLSADEVESWLGWLYEREQEGRLELKATCSPQYFRYMRQDGRRPATSLHRQSEKSANGKPALHQLTRGCLAGTGVAFISHKGEVFPCGYLPVSAGNVHATPFAEIWRGAGVFNALRDPQRLEGKCGACEFKTVCGGCRARAYATSGSWLGQEPSCAYLPRHAAPGGRPAAARAG